jgi:hypothetical protein
MDAAQWLASHSSARPITTKATHELPTNPLPPVLWDWRSLTLRIATVSSLLTCWAQQLLANMKTDSTSNRQTQGQNKGKETNKRNKTRSVKIWRLKREFLCTSAGVQTALLAETHLAEVVVVILEDVQVIFVAVVLVLVIVTIVVILIVVDVLIVV